MRNNNLTINGIDDSIAYCEAVGLSKVLAAYAENASGVYIEAIGFNAHSGYVYLALENGVQVCSCLGRGVEYLVTNPYDGDEIFYDDYATALNHEWAEEED